MKQITKQLKQDIQSFDTIEERLKHLKDKYKGETAYIVTCGPSLATHDVEHLKSKLQDKLVISLKQAQNVLEEETDFHLMSTYNLSPYSWGNDNITLWQVSKSYANNQLQKIVNLNAPIDLYVPVINPPYIDRTQTTQATCNFDNFYMLETHTEVMWGCGMLYETGIPLALLLGCKKVVVIGWDMGDPKNPSLQGHFDEGKVKRDTFPMEGELEETIRSTEFLYDWFKSKDIDFKLISDRSYVSSKFDRITLEEI